MLERKIYQIRRYANQIREQSTTYLSRSTLTTMGGLIAGIGLNLVFDDLYSLVKDFGVSRYQFLLAAHTTPAYFVLKGVVGNFKEYIKHISPKRIFKRETLDLETIIKIGTAGASIHLAGEYVQVLSFGFNYPFFSDIHMVPYWLFNIPGFSMMGKAAISKLNSTKKQKEEKRVPEPGQ